jgi:hypothetical protein
MNRALSLTAAAGLPTALAAGLPPPLAAGLPPPPAAELLGDTLLLEHAAKAIVAAATRTTASGRPRSVELLLILLIESSSFD